MNDRADRFKLTIPADMTPEVQVEMVRTFRSMQRWQAIKSVVAIVAFAACMCTCVLWG